MNLTINGNQYTTGKLGLAQVEAFQEFIKGVDYSSLLRANGTLDMTVYELVKAVFANLKARKLAEITSLALTPMSGKWNVNIQATIIDDIVEENLDVDTMIEVFEDFFGNNPKALSRLKQLLPKPSEKAQPILFQMTSEPIEE